jgi:hypothetical protein
MAPIQDSTVNWDLNQTIREPILALKLYALFAVVSMVVAIVFLLRNWIILTPFKRPQPEKIRSLVAVCHRQATGLYRWMGLNMLAWIAVTAVGLSNGLNSLSVSKRVGVQVIAFALNDLTQPLLMFSWIMMAFYVARWHILWRAERLDRRLPPESVA